MDIPCSRSVGQNQDRSPRERRSQRPTMILIELGYDAEEVGELFASYRGG